MNDVFKVRCNAVAFHSRLDDITLELHRGEFLGLVGANGAGKTTLLRLMNGGLLPDTGEVIVETLSTADAQNLPAIRRRVALVRADPEFQLVAPTVFEEIAFGLRSQNLPADEIISRVEQALAVSNLSALRDIHPFFLSMGEQHRLILAAMTVTQPDYLLLDELTSMLDAQTRLYTLDYLKRLQHQHGFGILLVTHRLEDVLDADRIAVLHQGKIVLYDTPDAVLPQILAHPEWAVEVPMLARLAPDYPATLHQWLPKRRDYATD